MCMIVFVWFQCVSEAEPALLSEAVQFGLSRHSHMTFVINPNTVRRRWASLNQEVAVFQ